MRSVTDMSSPRTPVPSVLIVFGSPLSCEAKPVPEKSIVDPVVPCNAPVRLSFGAMLMPLDAVADADPVDVSEILTSRVP